MYIDIETKEYPLSLEDIYARNPMTLAAEHLPNYKKVNCVSTPEYDVDRSVLKSSDPVEVDGEWYETFEIVPLPEDEVAINLKNRENSEKEAARITISRRQGMLSLFLLKGIKDSDVDDAINTISDPNLRYITKVNWQGASEFVSDSETVQKLAEILELSEQDVKELFQRAKEL